MLILSRRENECVSIGDNITIKIISIDKGSVKLGFEAPLNLLILREELKLAVLEENKKSLSTQNDFVSKLIKAKKKFQ
ncbi:MAG: carbon storage regulator CsrA [Helicobacter sp.]|nr:carbon storage regulator CsrA [Helicobacter sp.]